MHIDITTSMTGRVVRELTLQGRTRLSEVINLILQELRVNIKYSDLEPYYLVVVNGNPLGEGVRWDEVFLTNDDRVVILPLAFGGSELSIPTEDYWFKVPVSLGN